MMRLHTVCVVALLALGLAGATRAQEATEEPAGGTPVFSQPGGGSVELETARIGTTIKGELMPGRMARTYAFTAEAGDILTITMASQEIDSFLRLGDMRGNQLVADDDSGTVLDARIGPIQIPEAGQYIILATSFQAAISDGQGDDVVPGEFTLIIERREPEDIEVPAEVDGELDADTPLRLYRFEAEAGDILSLEVHSRAIDPYLILSKADAIVGPGMRDDDSGNETDALIVPYIVPESGAYFATVTSVVPDTEGGYALRVTPMERAPLAFGEVIETAIGDESPALVYTFSAAAGDVINAIVESPTELDTTLTILGPDGAQVAYNDDSSGRNAGLLGLSLPVTGDYTMVVQPFVSGAEGDVRLALTRAEATEAAP